MRMRSPRPLLLLMPWALLPLSGCADPEATARVSDVRGAKVPEGALESTHVRMVSMADLGIDEIDLTMRFHDQDPCLTVVLNGCPEGVRTTFDLRDGQSAPAEGRPNVIVRTGCDPVEQATGVWFTDRGTLRVEPLDGVTRVFVDAEMGDGDGQGEFSITVETEIDPDETVPWHPEAAFGGEPEGEPL